MTRQDCRCPRCDSYHASVYGFKEHFNDKHGRYPRDPEVRKAMALAEQNAPEDPGAGRVR